MFADMAYDSVIEHMQKLMEKYKTNPSDPDKAMFNDDLTKLTYMAYDQGRLAAIEEAIKIVKGMY